MLKRLRQLMGSVHPPRLVRDPVGVTLWGKADCCLCDRAGVILDRLAKDYPLRITHCDITADPAIFQRYRDLIPVIEIEGGRRFEGKITELWLRRALEEICRPPRPA